MCQGKCGGLGDRIARTEWHRGNRRQRQNVDDGSSSTRQQGQESLSHSIRAIEIDGEALFERGAIAQVIVKRQASVIDEDIEIFDLLDSSLNVRSIGHVQCYGRDSPIHVGQRLTRTGIHPLRASPQSFLDQRLADTAVGAGAQD